MDTISDFSKFPSLFDKNFTDSDTNIIVLYSRNRAFISDVVTQLNALRDSSLYLIGNNNAYKLQSLNSGALETNTLTNDKFCAVCALGSLTEDVEQITSPNTLLIRDSITQSVTYYPGDIIEIRINVNSATTGISCSQTFAVTNVRIKETETSTGYITELTLNKNILEQALPNGSPLTVTDNDQLIITITARTNNPMSNCSQLKKDINLYSFALDPEEHQPSGTCNFSKVESASLIFSDTTYVSNIYAVNYNVLRVMSGMAGIAYAA